MQANPRTEPNEQTLDSVLGGLQSPLSWDSTMDETTPLMSHPPSSGHSSASSSSRPSFSSSYSGVNDTAIHQAAIFIDDAIHYRSIHHRIDRKSLKLYSMYHSWPVRILLGVVIFVILVLAFFEYPTSITLSSDFRFKNTTLYIGSLIINTELPCGVTEFIEIICLLVFLVNWIVQFYLVGRSRFLKQPWLVVYALMVIISFIDLFISLGFCIARGPDNLGATIRIRRFFRPFFFIVPSSIMKKFIKAVFRTIWRIWSIFVLLMLHIYVFAMIGMLVFPPPIGNRSSIINGSSNNTHGDFDELDAGNPNVPPDSEEHFAALEGQEWFETVEEALVSLLVFLTTANNPDFMTKIYQFNRFAFLYFFLFLSIGLYLILNLFTAAIFTEFRGFLEQSMQSSFVRRRVGFRAAFAVLVRSSGGRREEASKHLVRQLLQVAKLPRSKKPEMMTYLETVNTVSAHVSWEEFRAMLDLVSTEGRKESTEQVRYYSRHRLISLLQHFVRHPLFHYFTLAMTLLHVAILTILMEVDYYNVSSRNDSILANINFFFFLYYTAEQIVKLMGLGLKDFFISLSNMFDFVLSLAIFCTEIAILFKFGFPFIRNMQNQHNQSYEYSIPIRIMNVFIVLRLLRVIPLFKSVSLVFGTMFEILKNLRAFAGIFIVIYYVFALLGMELFQNVTSLDSLEFSNDTKCASYTKLGYFSYNFHDFAATLVLLWNLMVVNNWYVFLYAFSCATTNWSQLYFIAWWLVSVIITINLFVSLIIEVFLTRWEVYNGWKDRRGRDQTRDRADSLTASSNAIQASLSTQSDIRLILRKSLREPPDNELLHELHRHNDLL